jgi:hypothetical protein
VPGVASVSTMNSQVAKRKEASAGGVIGPLLTYALLSFLPPAKESTSVRSKTRGYGHRSRRLPQLLIFGRGNGAGPSSPPGGGMRPPLGRYPGQAGKIFYGEPTAKSEMTDF